MSFSVAASASNPSLSLALPNSLEEKALLLSRLTSERDEKRKKMETLFEEMQSLKQQMNSVERSLLELDEEIDVLEQDIGQLPINHSLETEASRDMATTMTMQQSVSKIPAKDNSSVANNCDSSTLIDSSSHPITQSSSSQSDSFWMEQRNTNDSSNSGNNNTSGGIFCGARSTKPQHLPNHSRLSRSGKGDEKDDEEDAAIADFYSNEDPGGPPPPSDDEDDENQWQGDAEIIHDPSAPTATTLATFAPNNSSSNTITTTNNSIVHGFFTPRTSLQPNAASNQICLQTTSTAAIAPATATNPRPARVSASPDLQPLPAQQQHQYPWTTEVRRLLRNMFRIPSFREHQEEIIHATLSGQDVFCIMRTGGGKSLTYQLPSVIEGRGPHKKITLVISPLLSLIQDQEEQMNQFCPGSALSFVSKMGQSEHARRWRLVRDPNAGVCLIFVTPEKVSQSGKLKGELQRLQQQERLGRFVIDECHCATQWGHDFRPDYTKLGVLKRHFPGIPCLAVTATASDKVRHECCDILGLSHAYKFFRSTANRPNLKYSVKSKPDNKEKTVDDMAAFIKEHHNRNAGIIYTFSRKEADEVADKLCQRGIVAESYHSSVTGSTKEHVHRSWMRNDTQVVVATIAFGLGINKPDVRFVLHHTISKTLEAYYQESGRAGRDGLEADCVLYYAPKDVPRMLGMIHGQGSERNFWPMVQYGQAFGNDAVCKAILLRKLNEPGVPPVDQVQRRNTGVERRDVGRHAQTVLQLLQETQRDNSNTMTMAKLLKEWRARDSVYDCVRHHPPGPELTTTECERIIVSLLVSELLSPRVVWNNYGSSNVYLEVASPQAYRLMTATDPPTVEIYFPKRETSPTKKKTSKTETTTTRTCQASRRASTDTAGGRVLASDKSKSSKKRSSTTKPARGKRKRTTTTKPPSSSKAKQPKNTKSTTKSRNKKKTNNNSNATAGTVTNEVIDLLMSSSEDEEEEDDDDDHRIEEPVKQTRSRKQSHVTKRVCDSNDDDDDDDDEVEFVG